eukprot:912601-Pyramimonas_sp.AAC.2
MEAALCYTETELCYTETMLTRVVGRRVGGECSGTGVSILVRAREHPDLGAMGFSFRGRIACCELIEGASLVWLSPSR